MTYNQHMPLAITRVTHPNPLVVDCPVVNNQPRLMQVIQAVRRSTLPHTGPLSAEPTVFTKVAIRKPRSLAGESLRVRSMTLCPEVTKGTRKYKKNYYSIS